MQLAPAPHNPMPRTLPNQSALPELTSQQPKPSEGSGCSVSWGFRSDSVSTAPVQPPGGPRPSQAASDKKASEGRGTEGPMDPSSRKHRVRRGPQFLLGQEGQGSPVLELGSGGDEKRVGVSASARWP